MQHLPAHPPQHAPALTLALVLICVSAPAESLAQSAGGSFEITRFSVHAGGRTSSGGDYTLVGSPGQAEAAPVSALATGYSLTGGWLARGARLPSADPLFANGFESPTPVVTGALP